MDVKEEFNECTDVDVTFDNDIETPDIKYYIEINDIVDTNENCLENIKIEDIRTVIKAEDICNNTIVKLEDNCNNTVANVEDNCNGEQFLFRRYYLDFLIRKKKTDKISRVKANERNKKTDLCNSFLIRNMPLFSQCTPCSVRLERRKWSYYVSNYNLSLRGFNADCQIIPPSYFVDHDNDESGLCRSIEGSTASVEFNECRKQYVDELARWWKHIFDNNIVNNKNCITVNNISKKYLDTFIKKKEKKKKTKMKKKNLTVTTV